MEPLQQRLAEGYLVPGAGIEPARGFPQGIFVPLQLSPLHAAGHAFVVWTLPLPSRKRVSRARIRQGPSSLYTFLGVAHATTTTPCSSRGQQLSPKKGLDTHLAEAAHPGHTHSA